MPFWRVRRFRFQWLKGTGHRAKWLLEQVDPQLFATAVQEEVRPFACACSGPFAPCRTATWWYHHCSWLRPRPILVCTSLACWPAAWGLSFRFRGRASPLLVWDNLLVQGDLIRSKQITTRITSLSLGPARRSWCKASEAAQMLESACTNK